MKEISEKRDTAKLLVDLSKGGNDSEVRRHTKVESLRKEYHLGL